MVLAGNPLNGKSNETGNPKFLIYQGYQYEDGNGLGNALESNVPRRKSLRSRIRDSQSLKSALLALGVFGLGSSALSATSNLDDSSNNEFLSPSSNPEIISESDGFIYLYEDGRYKKILNVPGTLQELNSDLAGTDTYEDVGVDLQDIQSLAEREFVDVLLMGKGYVGDINEFLAENPDLVVKYGKELTTKYGSAFDGESINVSLEKGLTADYFNGLPSIGIGNLLFTTVPVSGFAGLNFGAYNENFMVILTDSFGNQFTVAPNELEFFFGGDFSISIEPVNADMLTFDCQEPDGTQVIQIEGVENVLPLSQISLEYGMTDTPNIGFSIWETADEENVQAIRLVNALTGDIVESFTPSNNSEGGQYIAEFQVPLGESFYYRESEDFDGSRSNSQLFRILNEGEMNQGVDINNFPNPTYGEVVLDPINQEGISVESYQVFDTYGRLAFEGEGNTVDLSLYPTGAYIIITTLSNGERVPSRVTRK